MDPWTILTAVDAHPDRLRDDAAVEQRMLSAQEVTMDYGRLLVRLRHHTGKIVLRVEVVDKVHEFLALSMKRRYVRVLHIVLVEEQHRDELDGVVGQREYLVSVRAEPASHVNGGERERAQSLRWTMAWSL